NAAPEILHNTLRDRGGYLVGKVGAEGSEGASQGWRGPRAREDSRFGGVDGRGGGRGGTTVVQGRVRHSGLWPDGRLRHGVVPRRPLGVLCRGAVGGGGLRRVCSGGTLPLPC